MGSRGVSLRPLAAAIPLAGCIACVPLNPSAQDMTGRWQIECEGGTETLELRSDGRYTYTIQSPRRHVTVDGAWSVEPQPERLAGARIILRGAPESCENADAPGDASRPGDKVLAPVWEWGRTELSYHPDLGGFRRIGSTR